MRDYKQQNPLRRWPKWARSCRDLPRLTPSRQAQARSGVDGPYVCACRLGVKRPERTPNTDTAASLAEREFADFF
jgi:hypothetical protein